MPRTQKVKMRKALVEDIGQIALLMRELIQAPLGDRTRNLRCALESRDYTAIVAEVGGDIVGFIDLWCIPDVGHGARLGLVCNLITSKGFRGRGIGNRMMREVIKVGKRKKIHELHVWTEFNNTKAIHFYKKHGFKNESLLLEKEFD